MNNTQERGRGWGEGVFVRLRLCLGEVALNKKLHMDYIFCVNVIVSDMHKPCLIYTYLV